MAPGVGRAGRRLAQDRGIERGCEFHWKCDLVARRGARLLLLGAADVGGGGGRGRTRKREREKGKREVAAGCSPFLAVRGTV